MKKHLWITTLVLLCGIAFADDKVEKVGKPDRAALDGTYTITKGEQGGKSLPADMFKDSVIKFDGDKITGTDKDKKVFFGSTFTIDGTATPHKIAMVSTAPMKGQKAEGIIEIGKGTVKLAYALPGGETPTEFKTKAMQNYFELRKIDKSDK